MVYGTTNGTLSEAEEALAPSNIPAMFQFHARLIAKAIILKSASSFANLMTAFDVSLTGSTGISEVKDDTSPEAGGDFSMNGFNLTMTGAETVDGRDVSVDGSKLDGIEIAADVTDATNVDAAGAVMEVDFNANTILAADGDDTPAALTIAEQTMIGRITAGNIIGLNATQIRTLLNVEDGAAADQTITLTGNVTGSGTGSFAATIAIEAVTLEKMAHMATASILGRNTGGTGDPEVMSKATTLSLLNVENGADVTDATNVLAALAGAGADVAVNNQQVTGLADPGDPQDAATKAYVDAVAVGIDWKPAVQIASIANLTLSGEQTIDGVLTSTSRILMKNQSTGSQNGLYDTAAGAWSRTTDADANSEVNASMAVFVSEGNVNADTGWTLTTNDPITVGSTALTFTQFTGLGAVTAGAGMTKTGNVIDVIANGDASITVNANDIQVATAGVTLAKMADMATASLIGRNTGGTGVPEILSATTTRSILNVEDGATADQTGAEIKSAYEGELDTNEFSDAEKTLLGNQSGANTGDESSATTTVEGIVERSTSAENVTGTDDTVYPTVAGTKEMIDTHATGGAYTSIALTAPTAIANIDFTGFAPASYDNYELWISSVGPVSDNVALELETSTDGGSTYDTGAGNYQFGGIVHKSDNSSANRGSASATEIPLHISAGNASGENYSFHINIFRPETTQSTQFSWSGTGHDQTASQFRHITGGGERISEADVDAVRLHWASGNWQAVGSIQFLGIAN